MASIRQRDGKWQVRVQRRGAADEANTFSTRADAERWARSVEIEMDRGNFVSRSKAKANILEDIISRFIKDVWRFMNEIEAGDFVVAYSPANRT
ncbi:hypothetical protein [Burkholderia stabilis]|uniref:hypothetical protein n=1 Tax=Burkholderia stabilis TaxID=95485 RepID=UPI001589BACF|nr:hypothetical protein [Burkholderia stabilis]HDR9492504.1 hypothetical protein [Burkholderia stabilis]HDR9526078.1 hypothetical protein [Burkholderia stabilis]HDR9533514.1 hypothetical protein [Burkholderia stabilis]HDR9536224.1 hypothetical protein [Burkholderia stabilis]HDR9545769.1 hypothetical protein [Burkholderia stabilis]